MASAVAAVPTVGIRKDKAVPVRENETGRLIIFTADNSFDAGRRPKYAGYITIPLQASVSGISTAAEASLERLKEIGDLPEDWNGYGAGRFTGRLIDKCGSIVSVLERQPEIFPTGRRSIQLQYTKADNSYLEFEVFEDRTLCLLVPQRIYTRAKESEIVDGETRRICEIVEEFYGSECSEE